MSGAYDAEARQILAVRLETELDTSAAALKLDRAEVLELIATTARLELAELERYAAGAEYPCPLKLHRLALALRTTPDGLMGMEAV